MNLTFKSNSKKLNAKLDVEQRKEVIKFKLKKSLLEPVSEWVKWVAACRKQYTQSIEIAEEI